MWPALEKFPPPATRTPLNPGGLSSRRLHQWADSWGRLGERGGRRARRTQRAEDAEGGGRRARRTQSAEDGGVLCLPPKEPHPPVTGGGDCVSAAEDGKEFVRAKGEGAVPGGGTAV
ncbi:uncharacterized protein LOC144336948 [Macaca mulatta]